VAAKFAGAHHIFTKEAVFWYGLAALSLAVYALIWQRVLKRLSLTTAHANKAVTVPLGILWGALLFGEKITANMVLGALVIISGVVFVAASRE